MKILIIGNGGREHAMAWKVAQSPRVSQVFVAPGNAGTALESKTQNVPIAVTDVKGLVTFAQQEKIDLTIVGPEAALAVGVVDAFQTANLRCFGPTQAAAQLETSKAFSKDFMAQHGIPTAKYACFTDAKAAEKYLLQQAMPIVIKADGLAAGKGVIIAATHAEAIAAVNDMLSGDAFGAAGRRVVIEEFLQGEEASFIVMADGKHALSLATSQDHKARDDNDQGPNTGGMGAYSPAPVITPIVHDRIMQDVVNPVIAAMANNNSPYIGFLYVGVMINADNEPKVLEFNCRLGDPETQPLMMRLQSDLVTLCEAALNQELEKTTATWDPRVALGVVLASAGYPFKYPTGEIITGLNQPTLKDTKIFHAGTDEHAGNVVTAGGRVLCVTALGDTVSAAHRLAYQAITQIHWPHLYYRTDIGHRALQRETSYAGGKNQHSV